jgi:predicted GNAT family N-acyltransferase
MTSAMGNTMQANRNLEPSGPMESLEVRIVDSYTAEDRSELAGTEEEPSQTRVYQLQWRPTEKHVLVVERGSKVCHVGLVHQTIEVHGNPIVIAGIGGVLVRPDCRGRGYCRIAMEAAEASVLNQRSASFVLLFCRSAMQGLYEHLGWTKILSCVWVEQAQGDVVLPIPAMVKCLKAQNWPEGEVRLRSRPW